MPSLDPQKHSTASASLLGVQLLLLCLVSSRIVYIIILGHYFMAYPRSGYSFRSYTDPMDISSYGYKVKYVHHTIYFNVRLNV